MSSQPTSRSTTGRAAGPRPVTPTYLERAAVHYLDRYSSSADNLRRVLARKARRRLGAGAEIGPEVDGAIEAIVEKVVRSGLVDDGAFADMKVRSLMRRGTSTRSMRSRLKGKGVPDEAAAAAIAANGPDDLALARRHAERKRLGLYRPKPDPALRARDLAALCRAGFPYGIAARALDEVAPADEPA